MADSARGLRDCWGGGVPWVGSSRCCRQLEMEVAAAQKHKHSQRCSAPFAVRLADWGRRSDPETERPPVLHRCAGSRTGGSSGARELCGRAALGGCECRQMRWLASCSLRRRAPPLASRVARQSYPAAPPKPLTPRCSPQPLHPQTPPRPSAARPASPPDVACLWRPPSSWDLCLCRRSAGSTLACSRRLGRGTNAQGVRCPRARRLLVFLHQCFIRTETSASSRAPEGIAIHGTVSCLTTTFHLLAPLSRVVGPLTLAAAAAVSEPDLNTASIISSIL